MHYSIKKNGKKLSKTISALLLSDDDRYLPVKAAFKSSYAANKAENRFTKVSMSREADKVLRTYFAANIAEIEAWFNIITPKNVDICKLKTDLESLSTKNWKEIY